jgi:hypothetical protein
MASPLHHVFFHHVGHKDQGRRADEQRLLAASPAIRSYNTLVLKED